MNHHATSNVNSTRGDFPVPDPHADGVAAKLRALDSKSGGDPSQLRAKTREQWNDSAPKPNDWIDHQLTGAVVSNVAAAARAHHSDARFGQVRSACNDVSVSSALA